MSVLGRCEREKEKEEEMNEGLKIALGFLAGGIIALVGRWIAGRRGHDYRTDSQRVESALQSTAECIESASDGLESVSAGAGRVEERIDAAQGRIESAAESAGKLARSGDRIEELLAELARRAAEDDL